MTEAELASSMTGALCAASGGGALVTVEITRLSAGAVARVDARVTRETRTLAFLTAEAFDADGARIATANSVHRIA
jgi:acyl-coenzyme A thioesterase PaaI-like protein